MSSADSDEQPPSKIIVLHFENQEDLPESSDEEQDSPGYVADVPRYRKCAYDEPGYRRLELVHRKETIQLLSNNYISVLQEELNVIEVLADHYLCLNELLDEVCTTKKLTPHQISEITRAHFTESEAVGLDDFTEGSSCTPAIKFRESLERINRMVSCPYYVLPFADEYHTKGLVREVRHLIVMEVTLAVASRDM
jgi:hypothetical protein